jgi:hypothetical protein
MLIQARSHDSPNIDGDPAPHRCGRVLIFSLAG